MSAQLKPTDQGLDKSDWLLLVLLPLLLLGLVCAAAVLDGWLNTFNG